MADGVADGETLLIGGFGRCLDMTGTVVQSFTFDKTGHWTVRLVADGKTRTADILIRDTFVIIVR